MNGNYSGAAGQIWFWLHSCGRGADGAEVSGEDAEEEEEEPSDVEPENQIPAYRQENKNLLATLFQISKS